MSFSFLNVIYPFFVLSLFLNLEEGLLEEFLVLHLVTGGCMGRVWWDYFVHMYSGHDLPSHHTISTLWKFYGSRHSVATGPLTC